MHSIRASQGNAIDFVGGPFKKRQPSTRDGVSLNTGALLVREWQGKLERVMVLDNGFAWNGRTLGSLSQVAKAITGTSWNGHRFFGLRSTKKRRSGSREARSIADENRGHRAAGVQKVGRAESTEVGRGGSKGIGRDETKRAVANERRSGVPFTRPRVSNPETKPHVSVDGELRRDIVEVRR